MRWWSNKASHNPFEVEMSKKKIQEALQSPTGHTVVAAANVPTVIAGALCDSPAFIAAGTIGLAGVAVSAIKRAKDSKKDK
jgi:hypothetical protein